MECDRFRPTNENLSRGHIGLSGGSEARFLSVGNLRTNVGRTFLYSRISIVEKEKENEKRWTRCTDCVKALSYSEVRPMITKNLAESHEFKSLKTDKRVTIRLK